MIAIVAMAWAGTALQLAGALALATRLLVPRRCYPVMMMGALALLWVAAVRHDFPQMVLMTTFVGINLWGFFRWRT